MLSFFLSTDSVFCRYAAWFTVLVLFFLGAHFIRDSIAALLLKLYEILVQKNLLP